MHRRRVAHHGLGAPRGQHEAARDGHDDDHVVQAHPRDVNQVDGQDLVPHKDALAAVHRRLKSNSEKLYKGISF